jgi:hypothetical protein
MALKACRECGQQVSTAAETCPHCGVRKPIAAGGGTSAVGAAVLVIVVLGVFGSLLPKSEPTPEEKAKQEAAKKVADDKEKERNEAFDHDFKVLSGTGVLAVSSGAAEKYSISGWNSSLDLYLRDRSDSQASMLAGVLCRKRFWFATELENPHLSRRRDCRRAVSNILTESRSRAATHSTDCIDEKFGNPPVASHAVEHSGLRPMDFSP